MKNARSMKSRLIVPFCLILIFQTVFMMVFLSNGTVAKSLYANEIDSIEKDVQNSELLLEREMVQHWLNDIRTSVTVQKKIQIVLEEQNRQPDDIQTDWHLNASILNAIMPDVLDLLHRSYGNSIYVILDGPSSAHNKSGHKAGVGVTDTDSSSFAADNSDLLLVRGTASVSKDYKIPLSRDWQMDYDLSQTEVSEYPFYTPYTIAKSEKILESTEQYGYLSSISPALQTDTDGLSYSIPLVLEDGSVVGVLGGTLNKTQIYALLKNELFQSDADTIQLIAEKNTDEVRLTPVLAYGSAYNCSFGNRESLSYVDTKWKEIKKITDAKNDSWYLTFMKLPIYGADSPYSQTEWMIAVLRRQSVMESFYQKLLNGLLKGCAFSLIPGILFALLYGEYFTSPIRRLIRQLRSFKNGNRIRLQRTWISELDELSRAIEHLSADVAESALRISRILDASGVPIGVFEYLPESKQVFCSRSLFELLGLQEIDEEYTYLESEGFAKMMQVLGTGIKESEDVRLYQISRNGANRYLRLKIVKTEHGNETGVLLDVSEEVEKQSRQIFEAVGISRDVIDKYFTGTVSRVGGIGLEDIQADVEALHNAAFDPLGLDINMQLEDGGAHKFRSGKEEHLFNPQTIHLFQKACFTGDYDTFKQFTHTVDNMGQNGVHLRSLLDFNDAPDGGIPLDEVEPVSSIVKRFKAAAMSYGALSSEAHETIAIALNRLGGRSNTGEGGEPEERYHSESNSKIKQVASARFGVTSKYLVSAEEIQIKLAQGAKPGEGGNLPGAKVYPWIAKTRHSTTGVGLISPPPHHDIYSIEDLAELIYDLKNANRHANINVKLVSEAGVGTIAAGVAKGGAQVILVSGYDGGTGAAPRNSIKDAGLPWELGIAETHQTLILNGLRTRVRIESDSKLLSGRDVAISCMLGAEEFGFGTSLLMTMGCVMMRVCNLDTCPMGICTQNPELRKHFHGKPEYIINYLTFVAQELREYMAKLGIRTIDELVGRTDLLHVKSAPADSRMSKMDLDCILHNPAIVNSNVHFQKEDTYDFHLEDTLDMKVLMKKFKLSSKTPQSVKLDVSNTDRAFGAIFGSEITRKYGSDLPDDVYTVHCTGAGGQSFGAFIPKGLTLELTGDCNDYMGKGLSGGKLIVRPPEDITFKPEENIIIGNVALYGATSGKAFVSGVAGERFCVRNSGAVAVVEGVGDHGCEYMTGGTVVVLGQTGKNFAAGMTGGIAYVLDENWDFYQRVNKETVSLEPVEHKYDVATLKELIREHVELTGSPRGKEILDDFSEFLPKFKKVLPYDYDHMLRVIASMEERGLDGEQAQIEAFYAVQKNK